MGAAERQSEGQRMEDFGRYSNRGQLYDGVSPAMLGSLVEKLPPKAVVLDVGCGDGSALDALYVLRPDLDYRGVDLSSARLDFLRKAHPHIQAAEDNAERLDTVQSASVDFLFSSQVIEHVDDNAMLASIARVLKPGSTGYLSTVWKKSYAWYFHRTGTGWALDPTHVREYGRDEELFEPMRRVGLRVGEAEKTQIAYPLVDPLLKRFYRGQRLSSVTNLVRRVRVPIPGYFLWEIAFSKP
jgi:ubiquinone/menaquinone biosynthesis C-methylase UbiE